MNARRWSKRATFALATLMVLALTVGLTHAQGPEPPEELDTLAVGFDGDSDADLAIGVPYEDMDTIVDAGAVNVLNGSVSSNGLTASGDQLWHQDVTGVVDVPESYDGFGFALAVGDFDGDGYADLAIGVPREDVDTIAGAGGVNTLYGMAYGLESEGSQMWHQDISGIEDVAEEGDYFGRALAVGDFNGDGYDDLAIGVPDEDVDAIENAGAVSVVYGPASGLSIEGDQFWHQDSPYVEGAAGEYEHFRVVPGHVSYGSLRGLLAAGGAESLAASHT